VKASHHHTIRWKVRKEYEEILSSHTLNRIINLEDLEEHRVVRTLPSRTVRYLKLSLPGIPALYLKEYNLPSLLDSIKSMFLSPAEREYRTAQKLTERNVPTFTPLAVGSVRRYGLFKKNYLVSKSIDNAISLKEYLNNYSPIQSGSNAEEKNRIVAGLAQFVKDLHGKGVLHQDFHWGNILIEKGREGSIRFYLMDLQRVKLKSKLTDRQKVKNLASLNTGFSQKVRRAERLKFIKAYLEGDRKREEHSARLSRLTEKTTYKMVKKQWQRRDKRCLKNNKYFAPFKSGSLRGFINRDFHGPELSELLGNPDRPFSETTRTIIKDSHTTSSCSLPLKIAGEKVELHIKRYNYQSIFYSLKNLLRASRGKRVWKAAHGLRTRSIPVPEPVAFLEERRGRFLVKSYFITRMIDHSLPLVTLLKHGLAGTTAGALTHKNSLIQEVAQLVRTMHERGISHGDLKSANILVQKTPSQNEKCYLVDLDRASIKKRGKKEFVIRDLARLNASLLDTKIVSTPDRLRFLKYYLRVHKTGDQKAREYWQAIAVHTQKKLKKSGRKFT